MDENFSEKQNLMQGNEILGKARDFATDNKSALIEYGVIGLGLIAMYFVGKSRGKIDLEVSFYPKGEGPVNMPKLRVRN